jgi:hypothetical protein
MNVLGILPLRRPSAFASKARSPNARSTIALSAAGEMRRWRAWHESTLKILFGEEWPSVRSHKQKRRLPEGKRRFV